nr:sensor domain-containing protein [uncultured Neokomagataea sp.]
MRVVFPLIAQRHQALHALPIAFEMASRHADVSVDVACLTPGHLALARSIAQLYPEAKLRLTLLPLSPALRQRIETRGLRVIDRLYGLFVSRQYLNGFDAIIVPEATSLYLRHMGVTRPRMVWTGHGAGDRAIGFAQHLRKFDFLLLPGRKIEERMLKEGIARPGAYARGIYGKFDIVHRLQKHRPKLFQNERTTLLYNPHFVRRFSSWPLMGEKLLDFFAQQDHYNVVFAPHFRLFDNRRTEAEALKRRYENAHHLLIDPGSQRSIDMTYTLAADMYIGDVSSQAAEFVIHPRPCLFLNAHHVAWRDDPNYLSWTLGPVTETLDDPAASIAHAFKTHPEFLETQRQYLYDTFETHGDKPTAPLGADAIIAFLQRAV